MLRSRSVTPAVKKLSGHGKRVILVPAFVISSRIFLFSVFCFLFSVFCFLFSVFCFLFSLNFIFPVCRNILGAVFNPVRSARRALVRGRGAVGRQPSVRVQGCTVERVSPKHHKPKDQRCVGRRGDCKGGVAVPPPCRGVGRSPASINSEVNSVSSSVKSAEMQGLQAAKS